MRRVACLALALGLGLGCESTPAADAGADLDGGADATGLDAALDADEALLDAPGSRCTRSRCTRSRCTGSRCTGVSMRPISTRPISTRPVSMRSVSMRPVSMRSVSMRPVSMRPVSMRPVSMRPVSMDPFSMRPVSTPTSTDAALDAGSPFDRCTAGCDHIAMCGSSCSAFAIDCATVPSDRLCIVDCLRGYDCASISGPGLSECSTRCAEPRDAAYPDVFALDTRADSGTVTDRCAAGCDYLLGCGFSTCTSLGVDCAMASEDQACLADCLRGFACAEVPGAGYSYCLGACPATRDAGPPGDAGPTPLACQSCAMVSCGDALSPVPRGRELPAARALPRRAAATRRAATTASRATPPRPRSAIRSSRASAPAAPAPARRSIPARSDPRAAAPTRRSSSTFAR
jgi:hypothetical protein